ncbi:hypothetical protein NC00_15895 [Xanthomonas cannabis pv. phaseoli]|uniref:Secreted protein n=1 Tax=Xanthomonas cannabis pv. phaseoli TaxID=1885902 RepID=A0AB34P5H9_9XANT|nr:hypothetical protein NC00_15895 [Xanthomonas cannabis pv. phaseoli]
MPMEIPRNVAYLVGQAAAFLRAIAGSVMRWSGVRSALPTRSAFSPAREGARDQSMPMRP